ncbi:thioredoxin family protein [Aquimarina sp. RZ0]|uniref:thioredoxin family protein n=1 Tax=Aquimarina sp. RZ0 TaxID=2607730 RepID=UPI0011F38BFB|nr:thioredoxin family protein [Aquimarina sp. RZ0]KAA1246137.1 thioredoxin family protein [Aquimarina sp. RZ0]
MTRPFSFFIVIMITFVGFSQRTDNGDLWIQDFETAKEKAISEKKSILLYFTGSDWCKPCKMLKEDVFDTEKFKKYENSYIFLKVDVPRNQDLLTEIQFKNNLKLLDEYNKEKSFPLIVVMSSKGKVLDQLSGYSSLRDPQYHYKLLNKFVK